jgi:hypothetical protein
VDRSEQQICAETALDQIVILMLAGVFGHIALWGVFIMSVCVAAGQTVRYVFLKHYAKNLD